MNQDIQKQIEESGWHQIEEPQTVEEAVKKLISISLEKKCFLSRGEPKFFENSLPTIARYEKDESIVVDAELHLIAQFRQKLGSMLSTNDMEMAKSVWGTLILMQHYNALTRLLDWTYSPFVALYFACNKHYEEPGYLWIVNSKILKEASEKVLDKHDLNPFDLIMSPRTLKEWADWMNEAHRPPNEWISFTQPMRATERLIAQQSVFTFSGAITCDHRKWIGKSIMSDIDEKFVMVVKPEIKKQMMKALQSMNITANSLFPDIHGAAELTRTIMEAELTIISPVDDW